MAKTLCISVCFAVFVIVSSLDDPEKCQCDNPAHCNPIDNWDNADREVIIATEGPEKDFYEKWMWESITTVLQTHDGITNKNELMCYTHLKGGKYGFFIDMPVTYDVKDPKLEKFVNETFPQTIRMHNADIVALDLLKLLGDCNNTENHINPIVQVVTQVITQTRSKFPKLKFLCVMPWKPPCYEYNCGVTPALQPHCDGIIINPESFSTYCSNSCRARATMPFTKLFYGLDDYEATGVDLDQIIIGIPWFGYNYTCETFSNNSNSAADNLCSLKTKMVNKTTAGVTKEVQVCDVEGSRQKVKLGDFYDNNPDLMMDTRIYSRSQQAPSMTGKDANNKTHMIWYEDYASLSAKYSVVYHHKVKGCIVYTADDLSHSTVKTGNQFNNEMFAWLLHTILATSTHEYKPQTRNVAGLVAGVGIGMFVFGVLLGAIIACIRFRQKDKLLPPFRRDYHKSQEDEYHDDDPGL